MADYKNDFLQNSEIKISLITVVFNGERTLRKCIESVISQDFDNMEYIIVDGLSTDATIDIINEYKDHIDVFLSEKDNGIYDAMNKGIQLARGEFIGMLNADDVFADSTVLSRINEAFEAENHQIIYGDLDYVDQKQRTVRKWHSGKYRSNLFLQGWMPPHPTFYCKRALFETYGYYRTDFGTSGDYELMIRFLHTNQVYPHYLKLTMVNMATGGASNRGLSNRWKAMYNDVKALRENKISRPFLTAIIKRMSKISQFFNN